MNQIDIINDHNDQPKERKTFLFCSIDGIGHVNCALSFASLFAPRGHKIYFFTKGFATKLILDAGYENVIIPNDDEDNNNLLVKSEKTTIELIDQALPFFRMNRLDALQGWNPTGQSYQWIGKHKIHEKLLLKAIDLIKPDIVITDYILPIPQLFKLSIPWIPLYSANPIPVFHANGPPRGSGYSVNDPKKLWDEYIAREDFEKQQFRAEMSAWFAEHGLTIDRPHSTVWIPDYMGVYIYPQAVDYNEIGPCTQNWFGIDPIMRPFVETNLKLPDYLIDKPGSLIYLSFGTLGSYDVELMNRIIGMLADCPHRFIVSKGPRADSYTLPDNMWGDAYVDQLSILKKVDLVITHGGNNTFGECFAFGRPMIIMPLFADQYDNAQRLEDLKLGRQFNPYTVDKESLIGTINELLSDENLKSRLNQISADMKTSKSHERVVQLVEQIIRDKKCPFRQISRVNSTG